MSQGFWVLLICRYFHHLNQTPTWLIKTKIRASTISLYTVPSLKLRARHWKWILGILVSFWHGLFSGAQTLVFRELEPLRCSALFCRWWGLGSIRRWENGGKNVLQALQGGNLGGGFKYLICSPLLGEDSQLDSYFSIGLKPPPRKCTPLKN